MQQPLCWISEGGHKEQNYFASLQRSYAILVFLHDTTIMETRLLAESVHAESCTWNS